MQTLPTLSHQEPNWDKKVNQAIELLNSVGGVIDGLRPTEFTSSGIVFYNGFQNNSNMSGYRYVQLPGAKLVDLNIVSSLTIPKKGMTLDWFSVPEAIDFTNFYILGINGNGANMYGLTGTQPDNNGKNKLYIGRTDYNKDAEWATAGIYNMHATYLHID